MLLSWCGWHIQVLCSFMKMLTWACYEAFGHHGGTKRVPRRRNKNGATATYPKMMPRQHIGSGSSRRYRCKRKWAWASHARWWGDPGFRVPTGLWHGNEEELAMTIQTWCKHGHLIQQSISSRSSSRGYTLKRAFGAERVRSGSSRSRSGRRRK